jgi:hypothetical protein
MAAAEMSVSRITKEFLTKQLAGLIDELRVDEACPKSVKADKVSYDAYTQAREILIPPHQREYCWNPIREAKFIQSILKGYPIPSILLSKHSGKTYIEDGRQRITAASRFRAGMFAVEWEGEEKTYTQLTEVEKINFDREQIQVILFRGATVEQFIEIFDWHQNGSPLTVGERLHAMTGKSPLVTFTKELLMESGVGLHDRAVNSWGVQCDTPETLKKDKRRKRLLNLTALFTGLVYGPKHATKKYAPELGFITSEISLEKKIAAKKDLERILEIYEEVETRCPSTRKSMLTKQFDLGTFTGYILYSLSVKARNAYHITQTSMSADAEPQPFEGDKAAENHFTPNSLEGDAEEWERIKTTWVDYIVSVRQTLNDTRKSLKSVLEEKIHKDMPKTRSWNISRWEKGYRNVFDIEYESQDELEDEEDEDEEDEDE